jgi:hypothetical protein
MSPNPVEEVIAKTKRAQRALSVIGIFGPFLLFWTIELIAYRGRIRERAFSILILCTAGIWAGLYFWSVATFRAFVRAKNHDSKASKKRFRGFIFGIIAVVLLGLAYTSNDGHFGAWPVVNTTVILRMLALPIIGAVLISMVFKRFIEAFAIDGPRRRIVRNATGQIEVVLVKPPVKTTTSQTIIFCVPLTVLWGAISFASSIGIDLMKGQTLSLGYHKIYLHKSPEAFWTYIEVYVAGVLLAVALCGWNFWEFIAEERKRQSTSISKAIILLTGLAYSGLLMALCRLFYKALLLEN